MVRHLVKNSRLKIFSAALFAVLTTACSIHASPIDDWSAASGAGSPIITDANTDSPTIGTGSSSSANNTRLAGLFGETVSLGVGDTLTASATLTLTGGSGSTSQYRFGIYNEGGNLPSATWSDGGWNHVINGNLYQARTNGAFVSTSSNALNLGAVNTTTGTFSDDSTVPYLWTMSITRDSATTVDIVSSLTGGDGDFEQTLTIENETTSIFDYNAVGMLFGSSSAIDQVVISEATYSVTAIPEPSSIVLFGFGVLVAAGAMFGNRSGRRTTR